MGEDNKLVNKIAPWLSVRNGAKAIDFYKSAFQAHEVYHIEDPDSVFQQALAAGATEVFPVSDSYGWRVGRLVDPFGFHWEIGRPIDE